MTETDIVYWLLALNMVLVLWIIGLKHELRLAEIFRQSAEKQAGHYRALYQLKATRQEARLNDDT